MGSCKSRSVVHVYVIVLPPLSPLVHCGLSKALLRRMFDMWLVFPETKTREMENVSLTNFIVEGLMSLCRPEYCLGSSHSNLSIEQRGEALWNLEAWVLDRVEVEVPG